MQAGVARDDRKHCSPIPINMPFNFKSPKVIVLIVIIAAAAITGLYFLLAKMTIQNAADSLNAPAGFKVSIFAENLGSLGTIAFDPSGKLVASDYKTGDVFLIENGGKSKKVLLSGLKQPYGLAFYPIPSRQGGSYGASTDSSKTYLYVAETNQVERFIYDEVKSEIKDKKGENIATLPAGGLNPLRNILFGPNLRANPALTGYLEKETMSAIKLYIGVGSSCDTCVEDSWKKGAVLESDPDGNYTALLAGGLRNPLFIAVQPGTNKIWAIDQNRKDLPSEIDLLKSDGQYGWPFCYGNKIKDESFKPGKVSRTDIAQDCRKTELPLIEIPAGFMPAGLAFIPPAGGWPKEWQGNLLIVFDSSAGGVSKIARYKIGADGKPVGPAEDFVVGWNGSEKLGKPVDLKFGPDGALYVTDDIAGKIYKVEYTKD
jgi:glucose/arabinose dehydrogenase